jgi:hypothetical protein
VPSIKKQSAKSAAKKTGSSVQRTVVDSGLEQGRKGFKLLLYGRSKTGKTRLASTFPKPAIIIGTEDGTKSIATGRKELDIIWDGPRIYSLMVGQNPIGVDFIRIETSENVTESAELIKAEYASVIIDTAGGLQDLILKEVLGLDEVPVQKSWGLAKQQEWGIVGMQFKERMRTILDLVDTHGINVATIAHERNFNAEEGVESVAPTIGAALTPTATAWLNGTHDYICNTYLREEVGEKEMVINGKSVKREVKTGRIIYSIRVGPNAVYQTGFRLPPGLELPDHVDDPTFEKLIAITEGKGE